MISVMADNNNDMAAEVLLLFLIAVVSVAVVVAVAMAKRKIVCNLPFNY